MTTINEVIQEIAANKFKMIPRINSISLRTTDLDRAYTFYKEGLGLPTRGIKKGRENHASFKLGNGLHLVVYDRKDLPNHEQLANTINHGHGFIISHNADSREEVDIIVQKALDAGARKLGETSNEPWSYAVCFSDPDGYQWEIAWEA